MTDLNIFLVYWTTVDTVDNLFDNVNDSILFMSIYVYLCLFMSFYVYLCLFNSIHVYSFLFMSIYVY